MSREVFVPLQWHSELFRDDELATAERQLTKHRSHVERFLRLSAQRPLARVAADLSRTVSRACVSCGSSHTLTGEHVLEDWLSRIGLALGPVPHGAGWLNRIGRDLGMRPPFRQKGRDVCGDCNHGWMSRLEVTAQRVLTRSSSASQARSRLWMRVQSLRGAPANSPQA